MTSLATPHIPRRRPVDGSWHRHAAGRRLIFLHIPKTAGTAITSFLRQQVDEGEVMPQLLTASHRTHPVWPFVARRYQVLGVGMHLDHDQIVALRNGLAHELPPFLFTVLREPRDRILSQYKEWRFTTDEAIQTARDQVQDAILTARTQPFSAFLQSENPVVLHTLNNLQARLLVGLNIARGLSEDELLDRARANLSQYDLIGTTPSCDETVAALADAYGWPIPTGGPPRRHVSRMPAEDLLATTPEDEERIAQASAVDQALWDDLLNNRIPDASPMEDAAALTQLRHAFWLGEPSSPQGNSSSQPPLIDLSPDAIAARHQSSSPSPTKPMARLYDTIDEIARGHTATRIVDLDRKIRYPLYSDNPQPPSLDERLVVVVRLPAMNYRPPQVVEQAALPPAGLLVITEVDGSDPRLHALLHSPMVRPFARCVDTGSNTAVVVIAAGALREAYGQEQFTALLSAVKRCPQTDPGALKALPDSLASRALVDLQLRLSLAALVHLAAQADGQAPECDGDWSSPLVAMLYPEDQDPLLATAGEPTETMDELCQRLLIASDALTGCLPPLGQKQLRFTRAAIAMCCELAEAATLKNLLDAYEAAFLLLCHLTTRPPARDVAFREGSPHAFAIDSPVQSCNLHPAEGTGAESFRWLGPQLESRFLVPVIPGLPHHLSLVIVAFMAPEVFSGATYHIDGVAAAPVCSIEDNCTVATFAISPEQASAGGIELCITAPFTASDRDKGLGTDTRQKSMAIRTIRVTPVPVA